MKLFSVRAISVKVVLYLLEPQQVLYFFCIFVTISWNFIVMLPEVAAR